LLPETFSPNGVSSAERTARREMVELIHRAYTQRLISSSQGTFSKRMDGNNFIITPVYLDRKYLQVEDLVRIENGKCEIGKSPSRSMRLHQKIYEKCSLLIHLR